MPVNSFSVGRDISFTLVSPAGTLDVTGVTEYSPKKKNTLLTRKSLTGKTNHGTIPDGWEITIKLDRKTPAVDRFFAARDLEYYNGVNVAGGTIYESVTEADGSVSSFRYTEVIFQYDGAGDWKGDAYIPVTIMAYATERLAV